MTTTPPLRALVLRAPGINCDRETAQACRLVGFQTDLVHINQLAKDPDSLLSYHFLVLPGGFSYGDDLGAGTLLAKKLEIHLGRQLHQFVEEGRPVLGICNGFQVLVRLGLLPGGPREDRTSPRFEDSPAPTVKYATLMENKSAQFECRWVTLYAQHRSPCIFTRGIKHPIELPVAHGEGQFVFSEAERAKGYIPPLKTLSLLYMATERPAETEQTQGVGPRVDVSYPANPNGSFANIAGICNIRGNVLGLMPHPERYITALQHPLRRNVDGGLAPPYDGEGDGLLLFKNAYKYVAEQAQEQSPPPSPSNTNPQAQAEIAPAEVGQGQGTAPGEDSYAASGVDIAAGEYAVNIMKEMVRSTHGPEVLAGVGAFAGVFSAKGLAKFRRPALVASTDGVGTKTLLASQTGRYDTIGHDIVNHSINDLLMQGAKPLFFMDYIAMGRLDPVIVADIVRGIAHACHDAGCALLGGETAEMPGVYASGAFDLAGTIVGVVEEGEIIDGSTISRGDVILGLASNGLHTNGYSLARRVFAPYPFDTVFPQLGEPLIDALLQPHRSYLREIVQLKDYLADRGRYIKGMAHITGGGFVGNISRILPAGTQAVINTHTWSVPALFQLIAQFGNVSREELYRTFNMGIGVIIVLSPKGAIDARCVLPGLVTIGRIQEGNGVVLQ